MDDEPLTIVELQEIDSLTRWARSVVRLRAEHAAQKAELERLRGLLSELRVRLSLEQDTQEDEAMDHGAMVEIVEEALAGTGGGASRLQKVLEQAEGLCRARSCPDEPIKSHYARGWVRAAELCADDIRAIRRGLGLGLGLEESVEDDGEQAK